MLMNMYNFPKSYNLGSFQEQTKDDAITQAYTCSWTKV